MKKSIYFTGEYAFLSNFYETPITFKRDSREFTAVSAESAFQSFKTKDLDVANRICQLKPAQAKNAGRAVELRTDWEEVKIDVMYHVVYRKFSQNAELLNKLNKLYDENTEIVFQNKHADTFWGVVNNSGQNHLGMILDAVYKNIKQNKGDLDKPAVIKDYCIIDHLGSIEDGDKFFKELYKKAYSLSKFKKTLTLKKVCKTINPYVKNLDAMKNSMRMSRCPEQVIVICTNINSAEWAIRQWLERVNDVTIIHAPYGCAPYEVITAEQFDPTIFQTWEVDESNRKRRCASIWSQALDYQFSAPLFNKDNLAMDENFMHRPDKDVQKRLGNHCCKISTRPEKFRRTLTIASDEEVQQFFDYYKYLWANELLEEFMLPTYHLCPHCGRPVHENAESCMYCDTVNEEYIEEHQRYFDTEEVEDELPEQVMYFDEEEIAEKRYEDWE